ncbi:hypothetical protein D3C83_49210 [compost metagenome]
MSDGMRIQIIFGDRIRFLTRAFFCGARPVRPDGRRKKNPFLLVHAARNIRRQEILIMRVLAQQIRSYLTLFGVHLPPDQFRNRPVTDVVPGASWLSNPDGEN